MEHLSNVLSKVDSPYTLVAFLTFLLLALLLGIIKHGDVNRKFFTMKQRAELATLGVKLLFVVAALGVVALLANFQGNISWENKGEMSNLSGASVGGMGSAVPPQGGIQVNATIANQAKMSNSSKEERVGK
ncbi:MAG: hypothetical protein Q7S46_04915 [Gallionella sp.]|nr:hypothetical protein [Gallionella sp.]